MKRKQQFLRAVQILAPGDKFILEAAQRVPEESLPVAPGGAALELVVAMQKLMAPSSRSSCSPGRVESENCGHPNGYKAQLSMSQALQVQSAQYWLRLGEADVALSELEGLPHDLCNHRAVVKARVAAIGALRQRSALSVQE